MMLSYYVFQVFRCFVFGKYWFFMVRDVGTYCINLNIHIQIGRIT